MIALVEKFKSIQGEGRNAGRPAIFIRYAGCNLDCHFADGAVCDTPWQKANEKISILKLLSWAVMEFEWDPEKGRGSVAYSPLAILTGGEPLMAPSFAALVSGLVVHGYDVAVETNGTLWDPILDEYPLVFVVLSPKDQIQHGKPLASPEVDPRMVLRADEVRYVITGPEDPIPPFLGHAASHYVSPVLMADGVGDEWKTGETPEFAPGAKERAIEIVQEDARFSLSLQTQKWLRVR